MSLLSQFVEDAIRHIGGPVGIRLRRAWYRRRLAACGDRLVIEPNVVIMGAGHISFGSDVWIDRGSTLIAGPPRPGARIVGEGRNEGHLVIGSHSHVGLGCVIQAHGRVAIGDCFTASAGVKIYSFSNDPGQCRAGTMAGTENDPGYRVTPVEIGRNVWLGLDALVIGATIGDDCFLRPQAVATSEIPPGSVADGRPARSIRPRFAEDSL